MMEKVAILDAGAQYGKVIDRRVRELNAQSEILPMDTSAAQLRNYTAIIISGGPESVYGERAPRYDPAIFSLGIPVLGICYGMQLANYACGGTVAKHTIREDGPYDIVVEAQSSLFQGLDARQRVLLSHGDSVQQVAPGFRVTARSQSGLVAAIENVERRVYGVQFHPEVDLTEHGRTMLRHFLYDVAGCIGTYTMENKQQCAIEHIQEAAGDRHVLALVSGGVDSTVCFTLLSQALGPSRVTGLHVDNGFMRLNESMKVALALQALGFNFHPVYAAGQFYNASTRIKGRQSSALHEVIDPKVKRMIIGDTFMRIAQQAMSNLGLDPANLLLAQGTLRPDLIESASSLASGNADAIKTHHNDTGLVRELREQGRIIEPLKDYHKDEVRALGLQLGLPEEIIWRQPFPGPGLAIRIICADKPYMAENFEHVQRQLQGFVSDGISASLVPIRTVGVQGDGRTYSYLAALSGKQDWDMLMALAREIPKHIHEINRIAYVFGEPINGSRGITPTHLTIPVIEQLQKADDVVNRILWEHDLLRSLSQVPVISFPAHFGMTDYRSIGIRTFITNDFMTGVPAMPGKEMPQAALEQIVEQVSRVPGIARVAYDLTSKPPGTTEWE